MTLEEEVVLAATILDRIKPEWYSQIDVNILQIASCDNCILGQLYSNFDVGRDKVNQFAIANNIDRGEDPVAFAHPLSKAFWLKEINQRKANDN